jgi:hypothetical protein
MKKLSSSFLLLGVVIWLFGLVLSLSAPIELSPVHYYKFDGVYISGLIAVILAVLIAPLWEEFVFRYGLVFSNRYYYLIVCFTALIFLDWQLSFVLSLLIVPVYLSKLEERIKAVLIGSLAFTSVHYDNFLTHNFYTYVTLLSFFGLSLILSHIRLSKGIVYAIGAHAFYNFFLLYWVYSQNPNSILYEDKNVKIEMFRTDFLSSETPFLNFSGDSIDFKVKTIESLLKHMENRELNEFHFYPKSVFYNGWVYFKSKEIKHVQPEWLGYSTTTKTKEGLGYRLEIGDTIRMDDEVDDKLISIYTGSYNNLKGVLVDLSRAQKVPIAFLHAEDTLLNSSDKKFTRYSDNYCFKENIKLISSQIGREIHLVEKELPYIVTTYHKMR